MRAGFLCGGWLSPLLMAAAFAALPLRAADDLPDDAVEDVSAEPAEAATVDAEDSVPGDVDAPVAESRVRLKIDVTGELFAPAGRGAPPVRQPIAVVARFDFLERPTGDAGPGRVVRRYADAAAELTVSGSISRTALANDAREVRVGLRGTTPAPFLEDGFLCRDELDLLETPFDPLLLDSLRPGRAVAVDDRWVVGADTTAGLLAIDTVESGELEARLVEVVDGRAMVKLSGVIDGAVDGVPTHLVVEGSWSQPVPSDGNEQPVRLEGPITGIDVTMRERREASHVAPGFDVEARLVMARSPAAAQAAATAAVGHAGVAQPRRPGPGRPGAVWHREAAGRYDLVHDARWRVIEDGAEGLIMRLVDHGALAGQCSIAALPRAAALTPPTIAEVERDVERSLEGQFGRFEPSAQETRDDGVRIVRVEAAGRADGLPFRWIHYVLSDGEGRRLAATFMVEESLMKRFAGADRDLIDGLRLPATEPGREPSRPEAPTGRQARLPSESSTP